MRGELPVGIAGGPLIAFGAVTQGQQNRGKGGAAEMVESADNKSSNDGRLSQKEARKLLYVLCVKYGFCLPPLWQSRLVNNPPRSINKFTDTVFRAEGLDPVTFDTDGYNAVREEVRAAFFRSKATE